VGGGGGGSSSLFSHLCHKAKQVGHVLIMNILRTFVSELRYDMLDPLNDPYYAGYIFNYFFNIYVHDRVWLWGYSSTC